MRKAKVDYDLLMPRVNIWRRVCAFIIDLLIIYILVFPLSGVLAKEMKFNGDIDIKNLKEIVANQENFSNISGVMIAVLIIIFAIGLAYWTILEYKYNQSIGKMLMKIKIRSQLKELNLWQVLLRNLTKAMSITSLSLIFLIDIIYMGFNIKGQRLTEKLSKTEVVYAE